MNISPQDQLIITSTGTTAIPNGTGVVLINPISTLLSVTLTLPTNPSDRDVLFIQFGGTVTSGLVVTTFSITGALFPIPVTTALTGILLIYNVIIGKWIMM